MTKKLLIYNSGGGIGDSIQLLPLVNTLKNELKDTKFYYLSAHKNHFNSTLKDFNCKIDTLDLSLKYFGFRWWHIFFANKKVKENNIDFFDIILDLQSKLRNTLILKMIPHKSFISTSFNFMLSKPNIKVKKNKRISNVMLESINTLLNEKFFIRDFNLDSIDKKFFVEAERLLPNNNYVGFSITQGNVYRKKEWPLNKIIKLSEEFVKKNKTPVFLVEKKYNVLKNKIQNAVPSALFPEHDSKYNSPALVTCLGKRLDLAISIDNGVMHMLSLSKVPIITLFGPTNPEKFAPQYKNSFVINSKKLYNSKEVSSITVQDVLQAAKQHLNF